MKYEIKHTIDISLTVDEFVSIYQALRIAENNLSAFNNSKLIKELIVDFDDIAEEGDFVAFL